jgi:hypothetical protein
MVLAPQDNCAFCLASIGKGASVELFKELYGFNQQIKIPYLPKSFFVLQDLVPLGFCGAHLLVLPKPFAGGHDLSFASIHNQHEIEKTIEAIISTIQECFYGHPIFIFEHGPGFIDEEPIACGGCHVDHAHGHIVVLPKGIDLNLIVLEAQQILANMGWQISCEEKPPVSNVFYNLKQITGINPYLYFGTLTADINFHSYIYVQKDRSLSPEAQFFRRIIAKVAYKEVNPMYWHWRDVSSKLTFDARLQELRKNVKDFFEVYKNKVL